MSASQQSNADPENSAPESGDDDDDLTWCDDAGDTEIKSQDDPVVDSTTTESAETSTKNEDPPPPLPPLTATTTPPTEATAATVPVESADVEPRGKTASADASTRCEFDAVASNLRNPSNGDALDDLLDAARRGATMPGGRGEIEFVISACETVSRTIESYATDCDCDDADAGRSESNDAHFVDVSTAGKVCAIAKRVLMTRRCVPPSRKGDVDSEAEEDDESRRFSSSPLCERASRACERVAVAATAMIKYARSKRMNSDDFASWVQLCDDAACVAASATIALSEEEEETRGNRDSSTRIFAAVDAYVALRYSFANARQTEPGVLSCEPAPVGDDGLAKTIARAHRIALGRRFALGGSPSVSPTASSSSKISSEDDSRRQRDRTAQHRQRADDVIRCAGERRTDVGRAEAFAGEIDALIEMRDAGAISRTECAVKCAHALACDYPSFATLCVHHDGMRDVVRLMFALSTCVAAVASAGDDVASGDFFSVETGVRTAVALLAGAVGDRLCWGTHGPECADFLKDEYDASVLADRPQTTTSTKKEPKTHRSAAVSSRNEQDAFRWTCDVTTAVRRAVELLEECGCVGVCCGVEPALVSASGLLRALEALTDFSVRISNDTGRGLWSIGRESELCTAVVKAIATVSTALSNVAVAPDSPKSPDEGAMKSVRESPSTEEYFEKWKEHTEKRRFFYDSDADETTMQMNDCRAEYWKTIKRTLLNEGWWWPTTLRGKSRRSQEWTTETHTLAWHRYACVCTRESAGTVATAAVGHLLRPTVENESGNRPVRGCGCDPSDAVTFVVALAAAAGVRPGGSSSSECERAISRILTETSAVRRFVPNDPEDVAVADCSSRIKRFLAMRVCCSLTLNSASAAAIAASARATSPLAIFRGGESKSNADGIEDDPDRIAQMRYTWRRYSCLGSGGSTTADDGDDGDDVSASIECLEAEAEIKFRSECCEWNVAFDGRSDDHSSSRRIRRQRGRRRRADAVTAMCDSATSCAAIFSKCFSSATGKDDKNRNRASFDRVFCACMLGRSFETTSGALAYPDAKLTFAAHSEESTLGARARESATSSGPAVVLAVARAAGRGELVDAIGLATTWMADECGWTSVAIACGVAPEYARHVARAAAHLDNSRGYPRRRAAQVERLSRLAEAAAAATAIEVGARRPSRWRSLGTVFAKLGFGASSGEISTPKNDVEAVGEDMPNASEHVRSPTPSSEGDGNAARLVRDAMRTLCDSVDVRRSPEVATARVLAAGEDRRSRDFVVEWIENRNAVIAASAFCESLSFGNVGETAATTIAELTSAARVGGILSLPTAVAVVVSTLAIAGKRRKGADNKPTFDAEMASVVSTATCAAAKIDDPSARTVALAGLRGITLMLVREYRFPSDPNVRATESMWFVPRDVVRTSTSDSVASADDARAPIWNQTYGRDAKDGGRPAPSAVVGIDERGCEYGDGDGEFWPVPFGYDFEIRCLVDALAASLVEKKRTTTAVNRRPHPSSSREKRAFSSPIEMVETWCLRREIVPCRIEHYRACECLAYAARLIVDPAVATAIATIFRCSRERFRWVVDRPNTAAAATSERTESDPPLSFAEAFNFAAWSFYVETVDCMAWVIRFATEAHVSHGGRPLSLVSARAKEVVELCHTDAERGADLDSVPPNTWKTAVAGCCNALHLVGVMVEGMGLAARAYSLQDRACGVDGDLTQSVIEACEEVERLLRVPRVAEHVSPMQARMAATRAASMAFPSYVTRGMVAMQEEIRDEVRNQTTFSSDLTMPLRGLVVAMLECTNSDMQNRMAILGAVEKWTARMREKNEAAARAAASARSLLRDSPSEILIVSDNGDANRIVSSASPETESRDAGSHVGE